MPSIAASASLLLGDLAVVVGADLVDRLAHDAGVLVADELVADEARQQVRMAAQGDPRRERDEDEQRYEDAGHASGG